MRIFNTELFALSRERGLTPTLTIKRSKIEEAYASQVAGWYAQNKKVVWSEARSGR